MRTRDKVEALFDEGLTGKEIARMLGLSPATISYHKERLGYTMRRECATRYDWNAVQAYYDEGHTRRECQDQFGFSHNSWTEAVLRGDIIQHRYPMPFDKLLAADTPRNRSHIKLRILAAGLKGKPLRGLRHRPLAQAPALPVPPPRQRRPARQPPPYLGSEVSARVCRRGLRVDDMSWTAGRRGGGQW